MSDPREKALTPRSLAAILNPDLRRTQEHAASEPGVARPASENASAPSLVRSLREMVADRSGQLEVILFRAGDEHFAVPLHAVREAIDDAEIFQLPEMPAHVMAMLMVAGRTVPVLQSQEFLGVAVSAVRPSVLVMSSEKGDAGLPVDSLVGSMQIALENVRRVPALEDSGGAFVGVFLHGETLVALLEPAAFLRGAAKE